MNEAAFGERRMYLLEHQAKELLAGHGVSVPGGRVANSPDQAEKNARDLAGEKFVIKAQIAAGGRGLAGGIKFASSPKEAQRLAAEMLNSRLVTSQTGSEGELVEQVFVEPALIAETELYLAVVVNQRNARPTIIAAPFGGNLFEKAASETPEIVKTMTLPADGNTSSNEIQGFLCQFGIAGPALENAAVLADRAVRAFCDYEAVLVEINPLIITPEQSAVAVDAKVIIDSNALPRNPLLEQINFSVPMKPEERLARDNDVNFILLDGNIGVVVNGAGLGLATHDLIIDRGGKPANFMDIRTTTGSFQIAKVVQMLIERDGIDVLLVNIHGGGMTVCDTIAEALNFAYSRSSRKIPIVYRAAGQNASWARSIMRDRALPYEEFGSMVPAVSRAVAIASKGSR
ncbi:MAG: acetate--CoA ligase family protein [Albidovulum sp.]|nr:acetate--CoA ligase family protein [Albidovulum sp.]